MASSELTITRQVQTNFEPRRSSQRARLSKSFSEMSTDSTRSTPSTRHHSDGGGDGDDASSQGTLGVSERQMSRSQPQQIGGADSSWVHSNHPILIGFWLVLVGFGSILVDFWFLRGWFRSLWFLGGWFLVRFGHFGSFVVDFWFVLVSSWLIFGEFLVRFGSFVVNFWLVFVWVWLILVGFGWFWSFWFLDG